MLCYVIELNPSILCVPKWTNYFIFTDCGNKNWQYNEETKLCYIIQMSEPALNWEAAKHECENINGHLATPSTSGQHNVVVRIIRFVYFDAWY